MRDIKSIVGNYNVFSGFELIPLDKINVPSAFLRTTPRGEKIDACQEFLIRKGRFDRPLVVNAQDVLKDGYIAYVVACNNSLHALHGIVGGVGKARHIYIIGRYPNGNGGYVWELTPEVDGFFDVKRGSRVVVDTVFGEQTVKVQNLVYCSGEPRTEVKKVLRIVREEGAE